jgi:hypothetical protein
MSFFGERPVGVGTPLNIHMFSPRNIVVHTRTLLLKPRYFYSRLVVMVDQAVHPDDPWLTRSAIDQLKRYLKPTMKGFEWGSGRSTVWFGRRLGHLVSIEHDPTWHARTVERLAAIGLHNVDYRLALRDSEKKYASQIEEFPDGHFDFILIDGEDRNDCVRAAAAKVRIGGWIVVDNADCGYDFEPLSGFDTQQTSNGVWRTDIFTKRL